MPDVHNISARIPPHSEDAEISVLGALLLDKDAVIAVAEFLRPEHFYDDRHKDIYECILDLYEERVPIDVLTVSEKLKKKKLLKEVGGVSFLAELANRVPTAAHVEHYGKIVKDHATKRSIMNAAAKLVNLSLDEGLGADELLDKAEAEVFSLTQRHMANSFTSVKTTLADSFDRLDELHKQSSGIRGVTTGFQDLDNLLAGMQRSNLIILAARPGVGKSTLAMNIAHHLTVQHKRAVGYFSLEMSREELVDRLLVAEADIDAWRLKTGKLSNEDFAALSKAMGILAEAPLYIDDTPGLSILEMRTKARRLQVDVGVELIIVDYMQLARSRNLENRVQEVAEISQGLKNLARELKIPVLALSQLSRAVEQRGTRRPVLADLRESGCLTGDTQLMRADTGERVPIKSLVGKKNVPILALDKNLKLVKAVFSKVFPSGKKMVYKLTLKSGKIINASGNHPFLKLFGWERLDKLQTGDRIAVPRQLVVSGKNKLSRNRIILLAHLIGDGCFVKRQPLHYTNSEMKLVDIVRRSAVKEFSIVPRVVKQKNWYHLYLSSKEKLTHNKRNPIAKWLDEDLGIYGQRSREKIIPAIIFQLSAEHTALFLKHLWATDGSIHISKSMTGPKVRIYYSSGNRNLTEAVSHLLLRLGIVSKISSSKKEGYEDMWLVHIQGKANQEKFLTKIGCIGAKAEIASKALLVLKAVKENPNNDIIPKEVWQEIENLRDLAGITTREFHKRMNWAYSGTQRHKHGISRIRLRKILKVVNSKFLENLSSSDIFWDEVKSIEKIGVQEVYDATVPKHANFVANDIIVHNSIEQDADVVMFLWKENDDSPENIFLDVSKHRNGPLGQVQFFFRGDRIRFYGLESKRG